MINALHVVQGTINQALNMNEQLVATRRLICSHCEFYNKDNDSCMNCGCPINKKGRVKRSHCPIRKW